MDYSIVLGVTHISTAALVAAICIPLFRGQVEMNRFYGMRLRKSFESDANWYAINRYGARRFFFWSAVLAAFGLATFFIPIGQSDLWIVLVALAPAVLYLIGAWEIHRFSKTL